jgi:hypothetical protein
VRRVIPILGVMGASLLTACSALHRDQVQFARLGDCPAKAATALGLEPPKGGALIKTHALECALDDLRADDKPTVPSSRLGSQLCLLLAARQADPLQREQLASEGVRFAEKALALGGDRDPEVHYYLAANLGLVARENVAVAMDNLPRLENEMQRAVALNPDIDDGGPLRLLGMLYLKAPPWPAGIGDGDKALDLLGQAVRNHPTHPLNHLFYAEAIWDMEGEEAGDKVRTQIATGKRLLDLGNWGYNREPWGKEFAAVQGAIDGAGGL